MCARIQNSLIPSHCGKLRRNGGCTRHLARVGVGQCPRKQALFNNLVEPLLPCQCTGGRAQIGGQAPSIRGPIIKVNRGPKMKMRALAWGLGKAPKRMLNRHFGPLNGMCGTHTQMVNQTLDEFDLLVQPMRTCIALQSSLLRGPFA